MTLPLTSLWNKYWFEQDSPAPICVFRILFGAMVFVSALLWAPNLFAYFGSRGMVSAESIQQFENSARFSILFLAPQNDGLMVALYVVLLLSSVAVMLGLFTRASLVVLFVSLISFHHRNAAILHSGDTLLRIYAFLLIFAPCGEMFSLDKKNLPLALQWKVTSPCWSQRLLQLQLAAVYCQAFCTKAAGQSWWDGTAVYYTSRLEEFQKLPIPFLFDQIWACQLLTYSTLAIELALWTLIWFKKTRYIVFIAGIIMHLGIDWTMNIPLFQFTMIIGYVNFLQPSAIRKATDSLLGSRFAVSKKM